MPVESQTVRVLVAEGDGALAEAVTAQDVQPGPMQPSRDVVRAAAQGAAGWVWVLDGSARPRQDALRLLLAAIAAAGADGLPEPVVVASTVLAADGTADGGHGAWFRRGGTELAMRSAPRGLLPIRAARAGSTLVRVRPGAGSGLPAGQAGALAWTARLLRDGVGYLATDSAADAVAPARWPADALGPTPAQDARAALAMLRDPAWAAKERLWLAAEAAGRGRAALRARRGAARPSPHGRP
jgi:hypothetical protein